MLNLKTVRSASRALHRMGLRPVAGEPGRSGQNLYDADEVRAAIAARPGRGARKRPAFFGSAPGDGTGIAEDSDRLMADGFGESNQLDTNST